MRKGNMENKSYVLRFRAVNRDIFEAIRGGKKKVETWAATAKYRNINTGDNVLLVCGKSKFVKLVRKARIFNNIDELLKKYKVKEINPSAESEQELIKIYHSFPGYKRKN